MATHYDGEPGLLEWFDASDAASASATSTANTAATSAAASAASAALSASLVGAPADTAVAAIMASGASASRVVTDGIYPQGSGLPVDGSNATGVDPTGATDSTAALQAVINAHTASPTEANKVLRIQGVFLLASTLYLKGNTDASNAVFNYTGSGVAIQIGSSALGNVGRWKISIGDIVCTTKPAGASWVAGSVGLKVSNLARSRVSYNVIQNFETGLLLFGDGTYGTGGVAYNSFECGTLDNNKVNQSLQGSVGTVTGWVNENVFNGGNWVHTDGTVTVAGMDHILIGSATVPGHNNNRWIGCSLEGAYEQYVIDCYGQDNLWMGCRYEFGPLGADGAPVRWNSVAAHNIIFGGYSSSLIVQTCITGSAANQLFGSQGLMIQGQMAGGTVLSGNTTGGAALTAMTAGWQQAGYSTTTGYVARLGQDGTFRLKAVAWADDGFRVDGANRSIFLGEGPNNYYANILWGRGNPNGAFTAPPGSLFFNYYDPTLGFGLYQKMTGTGNTGWQSVGQMPYTTAGRPAASVAGVGGAYYDTTLSKPGFSDGTVWRDAMGTAI